MVTDREKEGSEEAVQPKAVEPKVAALVPSQTNKRKREALVEEETASESSEAVEAASESDEAVEEETEASESDEAVEEETEASESDEAVEETDYDTEDEDVSMDDTNYDTDDDDDTDHEAAAANLWDNGLAAKLGNGGLILVLFEAPSGFAIFSYDGIKLLEPKACQNVWVDFTDLTVAKKTVWLKDFQAFGDKLNAINATDCGDELANMIKRHIEPGQKLAVGNDDYKKAIENSLEISCLYDTAVEELMWGLKIQMPYVLPAENPELGNGLFPMSKGMRWLLDFYGFEFKPNMMVTREIIKLAGVLFECDRCVDQHESSLRCAAELLMEISRIDTKDWDLMKLVTALKVICYPKERVAAPELLFSKQELVRMCKDAPKYEAEISKMEVLEVYNEMRSARVTRHQVAPILSHLLCSVTNAQVSSPGGEKQRSEHRGFGEEVAISRLKRKKTQIPRIDAIKSYTCVFRCPFAWTNVQGILSLHSHPSKDDIVAAGGADGNVIMVDLSQISSFNWIRRFTGHTKEITSLKFVDRDELFITGSADKTVRIWQGIEGMPSCVRTLKDHTAEVEAVTVHVTQNYFVTASKDHSWRFYDIFTGSCLTQVGEAPEHEGYTSASFHPDGLLLGTGTTTAVVEIWDVWSKSNVAKLEGHVGPVNAMSFSENGYLLATAALDGVKLWDVRKMRNLRTIFPHDPDKPINAVEFDSSGSYLAIGGSEDTSIYQGDKDEFEVLSRRLPGNATSLVFGTNASYIAVGSVDLRIFSPTNREE